MPIPLWDKIGDLSSGQVEYKSQMHLGCIEKINIQKLGPTEFRILIKAGHSLAETQLRIALCEENISLSRTPPNYSFCLQSDDRVSIALFLRAVLGQEPWALPPLRDDIQRSVGVNLAQAPVAPSAPPRILPPQNANRNRNRVYAMQPSSGSFGDQFGMQANSLDAPLPLTSEVSQPASQMLVSSLPLDSENADKLEKANYQGHIPAEFLCPLSQTIMTNPVFVHQNPEHKFEENWIRRHLRNDFFNPLNRQPLTVLDLSIDQALKQQIDTFVQNAIKSKRRRQSADELAQEEAKALIATKRSFRRNR